MKNNPEISVVMSVYNSESYLKESVDSILNQTFTDFEFILTDDSSTDNSLAILEQYALKDKRITLLKNIQNSGLATNLNKMISISKGKYIARMDADDISLPERLQKQYDFMENKPDVGVYGTQITPFGSKAVKMHFAPLTHEEILASILFTNPMMHPTVMFRKSIFTETGIRYNENLRTSQDLDLWFSLIRKTRFGNSPEVLLKYRIEHSSSSFIKNYSGSSREELLSIIIRKGIDRTFPELKDIDINKLSIFNYKSATSMENLITIERFIKDIETINAEYKLFDPAVFRYYISRQFFRFCTSSTKLGLKAFKFYKDSDYSKEFELDMMLKLKFIVKAIMKFDPRKND